MTQKELITYLLTYLLVNISLQYDGINL